MVVSDVQHGDLTILCIMQCSPWRSVVTVYHRSYFLVQDDLGSFRPTSIPALNQPLLQEIWVENDI